MTQNVVTIRPEASLAEAARLLRARRLGALPVVDASAALVGIISESDLLRELETSL